MSCIICTRHHPDDDGNCTKICRHHQATFGLVCPGCVARIRRDLDTIAETWTESVYGSISCGGSGSSERPLPGGTAWISWRHSGGPGGQLWTSVTGWARVWIEDGDLAQPDTFDLLTVLMWLRAHLERDGVKHPAIDEAAAEWSDHAQEGRRIVGDVESGQVIRCPGVAAECGRRLRVDVGNPDEPVRCRDCGHTWTTAQLLRRAMYDSDAPAWLDGEAVRSLVGVDPSTLRRWARAGRITRANGRYLLSTVISAVRVAS